MQTECGHDEEQVRHLVVERSGEKHERRGTGRRKTGQGGDEEAEAAKDRAVEESNRQRSEEAPEELQKADPAHASVPQEGREIGHPRRAEGQSVL